MWGGLALTCRRCCPQLQHSQLAPLAHLFLLLEQRACVDELQRVLWLGFRALNPKAEKDMVPHVLWRAMLVPDKVLMTVSGVRDLCCHLLQGARSRRVCSGRLLHPTAAADISRLLLGHDDGRGRGAQALLSLTRSWHHLLIRKPKAFLETFEKKYKSSFFIRHEAPCPHTDLLSVCTLPAACTCLSIVHAMHMPQCCLQQAYACSHCALGDLGRRLL